MGVPGKGKKGNIKGRGIDSIKHDLTEKGL